MVVEKPNDEETAAHNLLRVRCCLLRSAHRWSVPASQLTAGLHEVLFSCSLEAREKEVRRKSEKKEWDKEHEELHSQRSAQDCFRDGAWKGLGDAKLLHQQELRAGVLFDATEAKTWNGCKFMPFFSLILDFQPSQWDGAVGARIPCSGTCQEVRGARRGHDVEQMASTTEDVSSDDVCTARSRLPRIRCDVLRRFLRLTAFPALWCRNNVRVWWTRSTLSVSWSRDAVSRCDHHPSVAVDVFGVR